MKKRSVLMYAARAAAAGLMMLLAGCKSAAVPLHITREVTPEVTITRQSLEAHLLARVAGMDTLLAYVEGTLVIQGLPTTKEKPATPVEEKRAKLGKTAYPGERTEELTGTRLFVKRVAGEAPCTRFVTEFPSLETAFSLLSVGDKFWIRIPRREQPGVTGTFNDSLPRLKGWPTMRPQDLGTLLFCDDLRPVSGRLAYTSYMETWPDYYILHILRPTRTPEILYSRLWIDRQTQNVIYHQVFDPDGTVVAEARIFEYKDVSTVPKSKGRRLPTSAAAAEAGEFFSMPTRAVVFWPKENLALNLTFTRAVLNEPLDIQFFAPLDATKIRVVEMPQTAETPKE